MPERRGYAARPAATALLGLVAFVGAMALGVAPTGSAWAEPVTQVRVDGAVRFVVEDGGVLDLDGRRRLRDTVELVPGGPTVVNELPLEEYVAGVAEMPSRWAGEALKAQAVAARTYAWYSIGLRTFADYDICASTACQVFRGADVVLDDGERWAAAVEATAGEVLVDGDGRPVLARYFSTSGGRTYANEDVFPSSGARPYLVAVDDPDDAASPYHRWTVRFTRAEFEDVIGRGDTLKAVVPIGAVERLGAVGDHGASLRFVGRDGAEVEVTALAVRDFLNRVAPSTYPDRFPTARRDGLRPLPSTVPSTRFEILVADDEVVIEGQGWGHGVGMGQYGARGRAERGETYDAILAAYYNGLVPQTPADLPERIRVGLDGADEHTLRGDRPVVITDADGGVLVDAALGTWTALRDGSGWRLTAPAGTDVPLEVADTRPAPGMTDIRDAVTAETEVNKPVLLRMEVRDAAGIVVYARDLGTADAGTHAATWRFVADDGRGVPAGDFRLALIATDAGGVTGGTAMDVTVDRRQAANAGAGDPGSEPGLFPGSLPGSLPGAPTLLLAAIAAALAVTLVAMTLRKART